VSVAAEHPVNATLPCVGNRAGRDFCAELQPVCIQPVQISRDRLFRSFEFLNFVIEKFADPANEEIARNEPIELMSVNRQMPLSVELPGVSLIDGQPDQM